MTGKKRKLFPYFLVIPGLLVLGILIYYPFIRNVLYSFTDYKLTNTDYEIVGIVNYVDALTKGDLLPALKNSFVWVVLNMILMMLLKGLSCCKFSYYFPGYCRKRLPDISGNFY